MPPPFPIPAFVPPARPQSTPQTNEQARPPATARRRARALPDLREASPLPPFGSPAVWPPQSHNKRARRNARCSAQAPAPQPFVPVSHSTQAPQVPSLIDLRVAAPPSLVRVETPPPLHARAVPPLVLEPASDQQHLAPLSKKARVAVRIVDGNAQTQCSATAYGGYGAAASATRDRRKLAQNQEHADAAPASIALSSSPATTQRVYCYAVASRAAQVQKNFGLLHTATSQENLCVALAPFATSQESQFKE